MKQIRFKGYSHYCLVVNKYITAKSSTGYCLQKQPTYRMSLSWDVFEQFVRVIVA